MPGVVAKQMLRPELREVVERGEPGVSPLAFLLTIFFHALFFLSR